MASQFFSDDTAKDFFEQLLLAFYVFPQRIIA